MPPQHKYALPIGFRLRQYRLVRLLGHGGFGLTYLAEDTNLRRKVAIKEMLPLDFAIREADGTTVVARSARDGANLEWARQRFVEEGRTLAALQHPSILHIYDIFEEYGTAYLVTDFIEGSNLEEWLRGRGALREEDMLSLLRSLLDALQLVHQQGFLHRDIKPENILMDGRRSHPVLIDFGNARMDAGEKTCTMTAVLTRGYAPVEQYQTRGRQGPFTDVYALGAVLYRAITGAPPADALDRLDEDKIQVLCEQRIPGFSGEFLATIDKALRMNRADRWQKCEDWTAALGVAHRPTLAPIREADPAASDAGETVLSARAVANGNLVVCAKCGGRFPKSETSQIEGATVCAGCEPKLAREVREEIQTASPSGIWRSGRQLVTTVNATLPSRCVKCNAPAEGKPIKRNFHCHPPAVDYALLLPVLGVIVHLIAGLFTGKKGVALVSLCRRHRSIRRIRIILASLLVLFGFVFGGAVLAEDAGLNAWLAEVALLGGIILGIVSPRRTVVIVSLVFAVLALARVITWFPEKAIEVPCELAFLGGSILGIFAVRLLTANKIDKGQMWLSGCGPEFLAGFPEWHEPNNVATIRDE